MCTYMAMRSEPDSQETVLTSVIIFVNLQLKNIGVCLVEADKLVLQPTVLQLQR